MRVKGGGKWPADVMLVGEAPGQREEESGQCFVGKSGRELDRILSLNGIERADMYVTNVVKERPPYVNGKQLPPSREDIARDEAELVEEILRVHPKWIGALGRVAARWLTGREDLDMDAGWGLAYPLGSKVQELLRAACTAAGGQYSDWISEVKTVPCYHPAAGLHNPELAQFVWRGLEVFAGYVRGALLPPVPHDGFAGRELYTRDVWEAPGPLLHADTVA